MSRCIALACVVLMGVALPPGAALAQDKAQDKDGEAFELAYLRDAGPVMIRFHVSIGNEPVAKRFAAYLKKWFDFADRNGDGLINAQEVKFAPRTTTLLQIVRSGSILVAQQGTLTMGELGKAEKDAVNLAEFQDYYLKNNVQPYQVPAGFGQPLGSAFYDQVSEALLKALDANKDGKLSREELKNSPQSLRKFDLDDDELVTAQELAPGSNQFGGRPIFVGGGAGQPAQQAGAFYYLHYPNARDRLGILLLARYDKDKNTRLSQEEGDFDPKVFTRLDKDKDGGLDVEELNDWSKAAEDYTFAVKLGKPRETTIELEHAAPRLAKAASKTAEGSFLLQLGEAMVHVQETPAGNTGFRVDQRQTIMQQFKFLDKDNLGYIKLDEPNPMFRGGLSSFAAADRNGDGKLTLPELMAYADLATEATQQQVSFAGQEQGRTLFQLLDLNRDGRLSSRELLTAWDRLKAIDRDGDEAISANEIPKQHHILFAQGVLQNFNLPMAVNPVRPVVNVPLGKNAPLWFRKMDTNNDGEVSLLEFLGQRAEFDRIDANRDGLLSAEEAVRYDAEARQKK